MTKEELEVKIESLKTMITEGQQQTSNYAGQLDTLNKDLKDFNKPEITPVVFDDIYDAVDRAVCSYDFSDQDNYSIEYGIEYDGKVYAESIELQHNGDLIEAIVEKVHDLFKEADAPEDDQVNNVTEVKEVI